MERLKPSLNWLVREKHSSLFGLTVNNKFQTLPIDTTKKPYLRGRFSTVDLHIRPGIDHLLFKLLILPSFFTKQATLMRRSTVRSLPPQLPFRGYRISYKFGYIWAFKYLHQRILFHFKKLFSAKKSKKAKRKKKKF